MKLCRRDQSITRREVQVLNLIAQGKNNKDIAQVLGIAYHTLKNYTASAYYKLGVRSRTQAAAHVWTHGLPREGIKEEKWKQ